MQDSSSGSKFTADQLMPLVYEELRRLASRYLLNERPGHTLHATALVHEAYMKLAARRADWQDRSQFLAVSASAMRQILVDHARAQGRLKRGSRPNKVELSETMAVNGQESPDILDLDKALEKLAGRDQRKAKIVELLFFGGLTYDECAAVLHISPVTLFRELRSAKAWLYSELAPEADTA